MCVHMYFSLPIDRHNMLSGFGLILFVSDEMSEITTVEKIASKQMSFVTHIPAVHLYYKAVWRFPSVLWTKYLVVNTQNVNMRFIFLILFF